MSKEKIKKYIRFKRPEYPEKLVRELAKGFIEDDFKLNKITTMGQAIRFMDYVFSLSGRDYE